MDEKIAEIMDMAVAAARETVSADAGGPFGAAVIDAGGELLALAANSVLADHDPTAHAEIKAIRAAAERRGSHDLSGCTLLSTCYPCPMCLGAIIWANIERLVYGCRPGDAETIGFRDEFIYEFIEGGCRDGAVLDISEQGREKCLALFEDYHRRNKPLY
jgi:guanine deaminase